MFLYVQLLSFFTRKKIELQIKRLFAILTVLCAVETFQIKIKKSPLFHQTALPYKSNRKRITAPAVHSAEKMD